jgi:hypothetical protein
MPEQRKNFGAGRNASSAGKQAYVDQLVGFFVCVLSHNELYSALSLPSTSRDLALIGRAILSSHLFSRNMIRHWLSPLYADTSSIRNGVGRLWEVFRALMLPTSS